MNQEEEIKKLKEQRRLLNKKLESTRDLMYQYKNIADRADKLLKCYERIMPDKYYKISYKLTKYKTGEVVTVNLLRSAIHPDALITKLICKNIDNGFFELIDIIEVAS